MRSSEELDRSFANINEFILHNHRARAALHHRLVLDRPTRVHDNYKLANFPSIARYLTCQLADATRASCFLD